MKTRITLIALLVAVTGAFEDWPLVCISSPPMQLVAGTTNVSSITESLYGEKCRALLQFTDPDFVPITFSFPPGVPCSGPRVASFLVPPGAPNGDARVIWQCKRSSACSFAVISNGTGDQSTAPYQSGTVECLPLSFGTNTSTQIRQQPQSSSSSHVPMSITLDPTLGWNSTTDLPTSTITLNPTPGLNISNQTTSPGITQANSVTRPSIPPWTILTITHTVTTLLTTTLGA